MEAKTLFTGHSAPDRVANAKKGSGQQGFSMMELMISMTIFLVSTGAMYGLMELARKSRSGVNQRSELLKSMRAALLAMGHDAFNAGYKYPTSAVLLPDNKVSGLLGVPADTDAGRDLVPPVIAGRQINNNSLTGLKTDQMTFLYQDDSFNPDTNGVSQGLSINAPTYNASQGLDQVVPVSGDASACRAKDIMLITGRTSATAVVVTGISNSTVQFGGGDVLGINAPSAGDNPMRNIQAPAAMRRVTLVTYHVSTDGTLVRRLYANDSAATAAAPGRDQPLIYGVEDMQIEYVLGDGTVTNNPVAGPDNVAGTSDDLPSNQAKVRQVRVTLTVRSNEKDAQGKPFKLTMTSTFNTRNLGYDNA